MITIKKAEEYRSCNVCNKRTNVWEILFRGGNMGTEIALCADCMDYTMKLLESVKELITK